MGGIGMLVLQSLPHLGQCRTIDNECHHDGQRHAQQQEAENRVNLADKLVNRQQCGDKIIGKDDTHPQEHIPVRGEVLVQQHSGGIDKHGTDKNHQQYREDAHKLLHAVAEIGTVNLRQRGSVPADGDKPRNKVMDSTRKDAAEDNPQKRRRAELRTHNGSADGTDTGNVQKLDKVDAPRLHRHIIHPVGVRHSRSGPLRIHHQNSLDNLGIHQITKH